MFAAPTTTVLVIDARDVAGSGDGVKVTRLLLLFCLFLFAAVESNGFCSLYIFFG